MIRRRRVSSSTAPSAVIVSQLHRSPGVDFSEEFHTSDKRSTLPDIPERGSWIEMNVTKKENTMVVRIDQSAASRRRPLLRPWPKEYGSDEEIISSSTRTQRRSSSSARPPRPAQGQDDRPGDQNPEGRFAPRCGRSSPRARKNVLKDRKPGKGDTIVIIPRSATASSHTLKEDRPTATRMPLIRIYQRLRPGNPLARRIPVRSIHKPKGKKE